MNNINFTFGKVFLQEIAGLILDNYSNNNYDLSKLNIVLSSKRSQRRLLEILSDKCTDKKTLLSPPAFFTPKSFCKIFTEKFINIFTATALEQTVAWINATAKCEEAINSILVNKTIPKDRDFFRVAQMIMPLHKTLSGENLSIEQIKQSPFIENYEEEKKNGRQSLKSKKNIIKNWRIIT